MATIEIRNLGPIKEAKFDLNKVNVFMGPQSSGKSTIAKIISYCTWLDKKYARDGSLGVIKNGDVNVPAYIEELKTYHRLTNGYFSDKTKIVFDGEEIVFSYPAEKTSGMMSLEDDSKCKVSFKTAKRRQSSKVIYIPSERNFVSSIYNLNEYLRDRDLIQDFVNNWYEAKRKYSKDHRLQILDLGVQYYNEGEDIDRLLLDGGEELTLQIASSGLQAIVPLITLLDYVARGIYNEARPMSVSERDKMIKQYNDMISKLQEDGTKTNRDNLDILFDLIVSKNYNYSQFIIEEPEQNLFPTTQRDLVYYMLRLINDPNRNHRLTFTTHSPYILYALNNCMMGGLVNSQFVAGDEKEKFLKNGFLSEKSWINPQLVSVWEIEDGKIRNIQDKDNIISENYFDKKMTELTDEYYQILNYYKDEE